MGVYIKGMEIPESCWMCFARTDVNIGVGIADGCNLLKEMISNPNERLPNCPLIPIPPHGRLIDADALEEYFVNDPSCLTIFDAIKKLQGMPTIIPAEEVEK